MAGWLAKAMIAFVVFTFPAHAGSVTILALGDSLTAGYGLPPEQGFVPQLEAWLRDHGAQVSVRNGGVSGDTTAGGAARIGWVLGDDVDAVIVALGGNDMLRGVDPAVSEANLDAILAQIAARGLPALLVGMVAPENYGPAYKQAFDGMYPALAARNGVVLFPDFLLGLSELGDRAMVLENYMQPDAIHPNGEGVALIVARMGPSVLELARQAAGE